MIESSKLIECVNYILSSIVASTTFMRTTDLNTQNFYNLCFVYSRCEVAALRQQLAISQQEHTQKMQRYAQEERSIREENLR